MKKNFLISILVLTVMLGAPLLMQTQGKQMPIESTSTLFITDNKVNSESLPITGPRLQLDNEATSFDFANTSIHVEMDKTTYKPGETAIINITSDSDGINGSISNLRLESPLEESFFGFKKEITQVVFSDPNFDEAPLLKDWENVNFDSVAGHSSNDTFKDNAMVLNSEANGTVKIVQYNGSIIPTNEYSLAFRYSAPELDTDDTPLKINWWNGSDYEYMNLTPTGSPTVSQFTRIYNMTISSTGAMTNGQIFLSLNNANATWFIKDFQIYYDFNQIIINRPGERDILNGTINEVHKPLSVDVFNEITVNYSTRWIQQPKPDEIVSFLNMTVTLPENDTYLGDWRFTFEIKPYDSEGDRYTTPVIYYIPITITDEIVFNHLETYIVRGYNETTSRDVWVNETGEITVFSPNDRIVLLGDLYYETTKTSFNYEYFSSLTGTVLSNASETNLEDLIWGLTNGESKLQKFNPDGEDVYDGNYNLTGIDFESTWGIYYEIPLRGIYGSITNTLNVVFRNDLAFNTSTPDAGEDLTLNYELGTNDIKFRVEITEESLPFDRTWYITEFMEGNFTIGTSHYNTTLETDYAIYNETTELDIPKEDLEFSVRLIDNDTDSKVFDFVVSLHNDDFVYSNRIDPNIDVWKNYALIFIWQDSLKAGDTEISELNIIETGTKTYGITIRGSLNIEVPLERFEVHQGQTVQIVFNITVETLNRAARGLNVYGIMYADGETANMTSLKVAIAEQDGMFTLYQTIPRTQTVGKYSFDIFTSYDQKLGTVNILVTPEIVGDDDIKYETPIEYILAGLIVVIIILLTYLFGFLQRMKN